MKTERTTYFLMANLGSEMMRFFALQRKKNIKDAKLSADRAFRIMDQLMENKNIGNGKQEVAMLKKLTEDSLSASPLCVITDDDLNSYFMPFATRTLTTV